MFVLVQRLTLFILTCLHFCMLPSYGFASMMLLLLLLSCLYFCFHFHFHCNATVRKMCKQVEQYNNYVVAMQFLNKLLLVSQTTAHTCTHVVSIFIVVDSIFVVCSSAISVHLPWKVVAKIEQHSAYTYNYCCGCRFIFGMCENLKIEKKRYACDRCWNFYIDWVLVLKNSCIRVCLDIVILFEITTTRWYW